MFRYTREIDTHTWRAGHKEYLGSDSGSEFEYPGRLPKGTDALSLSAFDYSSDESDFDNDATDKFAERCCETPSTLLKLQVEIEVLHEDYYPSPSTH